MAPPARLQVPRPRTAVPYTVLLGWLLAQVARAADTTGRAYNLTWKSTNFKTILEWEPKPIDHVYTVQISTRLENWKSKCFFTTETECDLTDEVVKDVGQTYMARVLSYPARHGNTTGFPEEPPFRNSPEFTPILDTNLGQPTIQSFEQVGTKLNVTVQDARTLVRRNGTFLSLRAVFGKDLNYTLYYWRASSTGKMSSTGAQLGWMCLNRVFFRLGRGILRSSRKLISRVTSDPTRKTATTNTNEFLIDVDKGENYCFSVQAVIPSRKRKQRSPESITECTSREKGRAREMFFIIGAVVVVALLIIVLSVTVYKCRKARAGPSAKESSPLNIA